MDKISGIVPSSRRVSSVNLKDSPPVRPGMPSFGRPQGISTLADENKPTTAERAIAKQKELFDKRADRSAQAVQDMADKFFMQKKQEAGPVDDFDLNVGWQTPKKSKDAMSSLDLPAVDMTKEMQTETSAAPLKASEEPLYAKAESVPEDEREFTPPGSYLDVVA
jgi:hypothetical protein